MIQVFGSAVGKGANHKEIVAFSRGACKGKKIFASTRRAPRVLFPRITTGRGEGRGDKGEGGGVCGGATSGVFF